MIYIIEDDTNIRQMESYALKNSGYEVAEFSEGDSFFTACETRLPDLVILDIMLPGKSGLAILHQMRDLNRMKKIPVIIVSAKTSELDTVKGLDSGADDYITKPFGIMEFISRVKAILRRIAPEPETQYTFATINLDDKKHLVTTEGKACELTFKEYELLKFMLSNPGIVLTRDKLMDKVWGLNYQGETRTVDMHIKTLRQKLGAAGNYIKTIRNVGYKLDY